MHANCCTWDFYFVACSGVIKLNTHLQIVFFKIIQVKRVAFYMSSIPFFSKLSIVFQDIRKYNLCKSQYHRYNFSIWKSDISEMNLYKLLYISVKANADIWIFIRYNSVIHFDTKRPSWICFEATNLHFADYQNIWLPEMFNNCPSGKLAIIN